MINFSLNQDIYSEIFITNFIKIIYKSVWRNCIYSGGTDCDSYLILRDFTLKDVILLYFTEVILRKFIHFTIPKKKERKRVHSNI
jgi:hypothetical protein